MEPFTHWLIFRQSELLLPLRGSGSVRKIQAAVGNVHVGDGSVRYRPELTCLLSQKWATRDGMPYGWGSLPATGYEWWLKPSDFQITPPCGWEMMLAPCLAFGFVEVNLWLFEDLGVCVQLESLLPIKVKTFIWPNEATLEYSKSKCPLAILCLMFVFLCILSYLGTLWIS